MKKIISLFLTLIFTLPLVLSALPDETYGSGLYGQRLYGVQSSAKSTFTSDIDLIENIMSSIDANQSNTTLEITTNSPYSGFLTIVRYTSAPSGTGSSLSSPLNKYISISTDSLNLNYSIIKIRYSDIEVSNANLQEGSLRLYKWNGSQWIKFDGIGIGGIDITNNFVFANTSSFSTWGVFGDSISSPVISSPSSGSAGGSGGSRGYYQPTKKVTIINNKSIEISLAQGKTFQTVLIINKVYTDRVSFSLFSKNVTLHINESEIFKQDNLTVSVMLKNIIGGNAILSIKDMTNYSKTELVINEENTTEVNIKSNTTENKVLTDEQLSNELEIGKSEKPKEISYWYVFVSIMILLLIIAIHYGFKHKKEENHK